MTTRNAPAATNNAAWVKPAVRKIRAGDAENRANPTRFDAGISSGGS